jgi:hypothetical protein
MKKHKNKHQKIYHVKNWPAYNQALKQRGSLNVWIGKKALAGWQATPAGTPGAPRIYADTAIETALTIRKLFRLPLRQTEGFLQSLVERLSLSIRVPDYTTLSRRGRFLLVKLSKRKKEITDIVIDSSGVKVYGEGEWKVKKHGKGKRRKWKKIHVGIDADGEIRVGEITDETTGDSSVVKSLLDQETATIHSLTTDGAYDTHKVYAEADRRGIPKVIIPPRKDAVIWQRATATAPPHPRDANLRQIRQQGRRQWKQESGYHHRSLVESTFSRFKRILGERVLSGEDSRQRTELKLAFKILNRMFELGMPESYAVTA